MADKQKPKGPIKRAAPTEPHYFSARLARKMEQMRDFPAVIVEAPSGYGKTTAVRDHLAASVPKSAGAHWFTATEEAPEACHRRLCREIGKIDSRAGKRLTNLGFPNAFTIGESREALRLIECDHEAWLVLDNFQFLSAALPASFLSGLFEREARQLHIVIVTQTLNRDVRTAAAKSGALHVTSADLRLDDEDIRRYYALAGLDISQEEAETVFRYTDGWIIAVYLQLRAYRETGEFSDAAVLPLMENLIWNKLTSEQREFFLRLAPFETATARQVCALLGCDTLPEYALEALASPFIRYDSAGRRYEPHAILFEMVAKKRSERGAAFERECLRGAGDLRRGEGGNAEALGFYLQIQDYDRILSLDLSHLIFTEIGNAPFFKIALDIALRCPAEIRRKHPLSMLHVAWALKAAGLDDVFTDLLKDLDGQLEESGTLRAEWRLLSMYRHFPRVDAMLPMLRKAAPLFEGTCSRVILPEAPWCFGDYHQLSEFHAKPGEADREADSLEEFVSLYSRLTDGHGGGADVLFRAELAFCRGDMANAEALAHKAAFLAGGKGQHIVHLGAARMLADIALVKADTAAWRNALGDMERIASRAAPNMFAMQLVLDIVRGSILTELQHQERIADWLKEGDFLSLPLFPPMRNSALYVHVMFLLHRGELARFIGTQEAIPAEVINKTAFSAFLFPLLMAIGYFFMGDRARAAEYLERAAAQALPDGLILPFASSSWLLDGLVEKLIKKKYPSLFRAFKAAKAQFGLGWKKLHDAAAKDELPADLTGREREIALLAAEGLRNGEIAKKLFVAESTVRTHLRAIFQKLDIDRRAKLAEKLK